MINYIDFAKYLQEELGDEYIVTKELNNNFTGNKVGVVVKQLTGSVLDNSANIPYEIDVYTDKPNEAIDVFTDFAKKHNGKMIKSFAQDVVDGKVINVLYRIVPLYNTPSILENDIQFKAYRYSKVTLFVNLIVLLNISDVEELNIDGEPQEFISHTIGYNTEIYSDAVSGQEISFQEKTRATVTLAFVLPNKSNIFTRKLGLIRQGKLSGNTRFKVVLKLTDGTEEKYTTICTAVSLTSEKQALPRLSVTLMTAKEN